MINPERLLSGLVRSGMRRRRGLGKLITSGAGLGLAGVAMEAIEHFVNQTDKPKSPPPPIPIANQNASASSLQNQTGTIPPPPPPGSESTQSSKPKIQPGQQDSVLLIRAMIAAAHADGVIDKNEREQILGKLKKLQLNDEEMSFITHELLSPVGLDTIISQVRNSKTSEIAQSVYTVSLLAIDPDTDAEKRYIKSLGRQLGIDTRLIKEIHAKCNVETPI